MTDILTEFREIVCRLNEDEIEYAVCGGWALAIHGAPRATVDIDLLVLTKDLPATWSIAASLGYDVEGLPLSFDNGAIEIRRVSKIDKASGTLFTIDFLLVTEALQPMWDAREYFEWEGGRVSAVSREGLISMKRLSGRHQDLADIEALLSDEN